MLKKLKLSLFTLIVLCPTLKAAPTIYTVTGKLSSAQRSIVERVFLSKFKELKKQHPSAEFKVIEDITNSSLIDILSNKQTLGLLYIGHPAVSIVGEGDERRILHGYLQTPSGTYLPKDIFTAAHENLKFLSIMTCHDSAVTPLYTKYIKEKTFDLLRSPTHNLDELKNPLLEFTSYYSTPQVLDILKPRLETYIYEFEETVSTGRSQLTITWRDQVSAHFSYVVTLNDKIIGVLESSKSNRGRIVNRQSKTIKIDRELRPGDRLVIKPDDANRPKKEESKDSKVIDDILIDQVIAEFGNQKILLLDSPIHIGDEEVSPDEGLPLGFLRNREDFRVAKFHKTWSEVVP